MARRTRICPAGIPQHIVHRGNNRQGCFHDVSDFATYYAFLEQYSDEFPVDIHAWVLMTNHIHLLVTPRENDVIAPFMKAVSQRYAQYYNFKNQRTGSLWEGRYRACVVDTEPYFLHCQRYIELNPVMARITGHPDGYQWSSYGNHAHGMATAFHTPHECYLDLGAPGRPRQRAWEEFVASQTPKGMADQIRHSVMSSWALGSLAFRKRVQALVE